MRLTSWRHLPHWGSPEDWAASKTPHIASRCSPQHVPNRKTQREREIRHRGSGILQSMDSVEKPTDPVLIPKTDNLKHIATYYWWSTKTYKAKANNTQDCICNHKPKHLLYTCFFTSISVWKLKRSIFCQLLPSNARTFHACSSTEKRRKHC